MRVLRYFAARYPGRSLGVLACLLLAGLMEGLGLSTLLPLISLATGAGDPAPGGLEARVLDEIIRPTVAGMQSEGNRYRGFLYAGLMIDAAGAPRVVEYNCRFGDPETQPIMMRLQSDLVEVCLAACHGQLQQQRLQWDPRASLGVVLAANGYPDSYPRGEVIGGIPAESIDGKVFHAGTAFDDQGNLVTAGGRVLCAVGLGDSIAAAQRQAYELVEQIEWDSAYYRRDIGFKAL